jgi:hypothetical protein
MSGGNPMQAAEALAEMVWDIIGDLPDAVDKEILRAAAGRCLVVLKLSTCLLRALPAAARGQKCTGS